MNGRTQVLKRIGAIVAGLVAFAAVAIGVGVWPFGGADDTATADQVLNRAQVARITDSPHLATVALPLDLPPHLDYLQTVRIEAQASEVHFQELGVFVVMCGGDDIDSACDADTATVFRDEELNAERIRVAWVVSPDATAKTAQEATPVQRAQIENFWKDVDLQLGVPSWLRTFS